MAIFVEKLLKFNENMLELENDEIKIRANEFFEILCHSVHCDCPKLILEENEESFLYKLSNETLTLNIKFIKNFQKFAYLFLLDTLFVVARTLMQRNFKLFLKEREQLGGKFFEVEENRNLPQEFKEMFRLDDIILLYSQLEKDKSSWFSVSMFDRRAFAFRAMENYFKLFHFDGANDYLNYLKEVFTLSSEEAQPETPTQIEDKIIAKYKIENELGFLQELELRERIFKDIENVLGV